MPSKSKSQQKLMGQAYALKKGDLKYSDLDPKYADKIKDISDSMTKKELKEYASTKHDNIPEEVNNESRILSFTSYTNSNM